MENKINKRIPDIRKNFCLGLFMIVTAVTVFLWPNASWAKGVDTSSLINLTNQERISLGETPLNENPLLARAAAAKARAILDSQTFQHTIGDRTFSSWIKETGYAYAFIGENLAMDFDSNQEMVNAWMASPAHKQNLLNPRFEEIGIAAIRGNYHGQETTIVAQIFGKPITNSLASPVAVPSSKDSKIKKISEIALNAADNKLFILSAGLGDNGRIIRVSTSRFLKAAKEFNLEKFLLTGSSLRFVDMANEDLISYLNLIFLASTLIFLSLLMAEHVFNFEEQEAREAAI